MKTLIVGGFPRAGTRQFADILNSSGYACLQGEVSRPAYAALANFIEVTSRGHRNEKRKNAFDQRRLPLILDNIRAISKVNKEPIAWNFAVPFLGFKCPHIEIYKVSTDSLFQCENSDITFMACLRNFKQNFLSLKSMFEWDIDRYINKTTASISALIEMQNDPHYNFIPLSLDEFIASQEKGDWISKHMFDPLGVSIDPTDCYAVFLRTKNRN